MNFKYTVHTIIRIFFPPENTRNRKKKIKTHKKVTLFFKHKKPQNMFGKLQHEKKQLSKRKKYTP